MHGSTRSHAMREYWRRRRRNEQQSASTSSHDSAVKVARQDIPRGIPGQILAGMDRLLACGRLDPFDSFPVQLTPEHHKLIHHCVAVHNFPRPLYSRLSTYAGMVFGAHPTDSFNPMIDVWFPLDLSNAASFNAIMAHAAAHLNMMQGKKRSTEALRFKNEAIRIISDWMTASSGCPNDEVFAAVVRLLTFERYWGVEHEWTVHRQGLASMTQARGGIAALKDNWRLQLVVYLISLMSKPSWFDSSNETGIVSLATNSTPLIGSTENLHRLRCLWLLSFVQDMTNFTKRLHMVSPKGLTPLKSVERSVQLLQKSMLVFNVCLDEIQQGDLAAKQLQCLFFICVLLQDNRHTTVEANLSSSNKHTSRLTQSVPLIERLDIFLEEHQIYWEQSVVHLHQLLFDNYVDADLAKIADYAMHMTEVLLALSTEARYGVQVCLVNILLRDNIEGRDDSLYGDETPDSLLSSLHRW
ncbi:hypothetical protein BKA67DRAFT_682151 [Truncatella angustata]|uniref:Uncharacterized protein n=1 Tax=Truncatella angustata TaxID=152316 RepID=A0A9P8ZTL9_9PEZI|nr:uncharacterized protein BKA67DRAFT_682151 [Truncatella angustata]KAH6649040.1 hypothetical protein BKA67DRAFT_682151 [Truncatella angustata]